MLGMASLNQLEIARSQEEKKNAFSRFFFFFFLAVTVSKKKGSRNEARGESTRRALELEVAVIVGFLFKGCREKSHLGFIVTWISHPAQPPPFSSEQKKKLAFSQ
jgi:hypothetical protein